MTPDWDRLAALAWSQIWQVTLVAVVVGALAMLVARRRPHLAHALWLLVIFKCLMPPVWSSPTGAFSWAAAEPASPIAAAPSPGVVASEATPPRERPEALPVVASLAAEDEQVVNVSEATVVSPERPAINAVAWLGLLWMAGAAVYLLATLAAGFVWLRRLGRSRVEITRPLALAISDLSRRLHVRRKVRFRITSEPIGPAVYGVFRPTLVLPTVLLPEKASGSLEPILAHELLHARRGDGLVCLLQWLAQAAWWFHPLVWWANRRLSQVREQCCDEEVLAALGCEPADYAKSLLDLLTLKHSLRPRLAFPGARPMEVTMKRLENIMDRTRRFSARTPRWCWAVLAVGLLFFLPGAALDGGSVSATAAVAQDGSQSKNAPGSTSPEKWRIAATLARQTGAVMSLAFSPDGRRLFSGGSDGRIRLWDTRTRKEVLSAVAYEGNAKTCRAIAISPSGDVLASGGFSGQVKLWDARTLQLQRTLAYSGPIYSLAFSRDGELIAAAGEHTVRIWSVSAGKQRHSLAVGMWPITGLAFSQDGSVLLVGGGPDMGPGTAAAKSGVVRAWNYSTGAKLGEVELPYSVEGLDLSKDGRTVAVGAVALYVFDLATEDGRVTFTKRFSALEQRSREGVPVFQERFRQVAVSLDGTVVAGAAGSPGPLAAEAGHVALFVLGDGRRVAQLQTPRRARRNGQAGEYDVLAVAFSPDGRLVASGGREHTITLWTSVNSDERDTSSHTPASKASSMSSKQATKSRNRDPLGLPYDLGPPSDPTLQPPRSVRDPNDMPSLPAGFAEATGPIRPFDLLYIRAIGTLLDQPIYGYYLIDPEGQVNLGPAYGRVDLNGAALDEANRRCEKQLQVVVIKPFIKVKRIGRVTRWHKAIVPEGPYHIEVGDILLINVMGTLLDLPINNYYMVEPAGSVDLFVYGDPLVQGRTFDEAEKTITQTLKSMLADPKTAVTMGRWKTVECPLPKTPYRIARGDLLQIRVLGTLVDQPVNNTLVVEPSGTVQLGPAYGRARILGLSLVEAEKTIREHLKQTLANPHVSVTPAGWKTLAPLSAPAVDPSQETAPLQDARRLQETEPPPKTEPRP